MNYRLRLLLKMSQIVSCRSILTSMVTAPPRDWIHVCLHSRGKRKTRLSLFSKYGSPKYGALKSFSWSNLATIIFTVLLFVSDKGTVTSCEKWTLLPPCLILSRWLWGPYSCLILFSLWQQPGKCVTIRRAVEILLEEDHMNIRSNLFTASQKTT